MRIMKIPIYCLALIIVTAGVSYAQIINCDAIGESPTNIVKIIYTQGLQGDTINVPVHVTNDTGIATFQIYIEYDKTIITPVVTGVDTLYDDTLGTIIAIQEYYDYLIAGRFLKTDTTQGPLGQVIDTITNVQVVSEVDFPSPDSVTNSRLKILALPDFANPQTVIDIGADTIMFLRFVISDSALLGSLARVDFYTETIEIRDTVFPYDIIRTDCIYSRYGDVSGIVDVRFTTEWAAVQVEAPGALPTIVSYSANPSTINPGGSSTLSWDVSNATSLSISGVGSVTPVTSGSVSVSPTTTTTYTLTASNTAGSVQQSVTVTVVGTNNPPVIQPVSGSPFTVNQGETVTFSVTATDADASDIITLSATSLPPNANFNTVTGSGSVTGNFSFTPDFTQSGSLVAVFEANDGQGGVATLSVVINVIELVNDRLFTTSAVGQQPVGGLIGKGAVYLPVNMVTSQTVYGVQFDFLYDQVNFKIDSFVVTGRLPNYVIYDNLGQTPGEVRVVTFGLANESIVNIDDTTAIMYIVMTIDSSPSWGSYAVYFENGWESVDPDPNFPSLQLVTDSGVVQVDRLGDPNLDQRIDVADLVSIIAHIMNNFTFNSRQFDAADVVVNTTIDIFDLVGVINLVFGVPLATNPLQYFDDEIATLTLDYNDLSAGGNDILVVRSELPTEIAAVELEIDYDPSSVMLGKPSLAPDAEQLEIRFNDNNNGNLKVLLYFSNPFNSSQLIQRGAAELLDIPITAKDELVSGNEDQLKISKVLLSTASAEMVIVEGFDGHNEPLPVSFHLSQNYPNPFNPITTIDFSIDISQHVSLDIYNILGQRVRTLVDEYYTAGNHSVQWNATDDRGQHVATGIYMYKLKVDQQTKSKKMLFLK